VDEPTRSTPASVERGPEERLARRFLEEVLGQGRIEVTAEVFTEDVLDHRPDGDTRGVQALRLWVRELLRAFPNLAVAIHRVLVEPPIAMAWFSWHGTRSFMGLPRSGGSVTIGSVNVFRSEAGRLAERWQFFDLRSGHNLMPSHRGSATWSHLGSGGRPLLRTRW
jgi:predicted ester cyclase